MKLTLLSPTKALSKAYLKQSLKREQIEQFKSALRRMFERIRAGESEEHHKNIVADFLKDTWYKPAFEINTSGRADLVIHNGKSSSDSVGIIIEVKRPSNTAEMLSSDRPNVKALHELLHYYLQERYVKDNKEIKHLIICNIYEWYIFDAVDFERFFFGNPHFVKSYRDWKKGTLPGMTTDWFYQEIARPFIEEKLAELSCTCFNLKEYERIVRNKKSSQPAETAETSNDKKLINLYKLLSPFHLLKLPFANDSNSLNREFYSELLHIIGLEEVKDKGKKLIRRKAAGARNDGSLLENTISVLTSQRVLENLEQNDQFGATDEDCLFSIGLELCITWLDRILFLKLLEGQLIAHHRGDRSRAFLNSRKIEGFDGLQELFFEVLAVRMNDRAAEVQTRYGAIPYLNSSLFEPTDLERKTVHISSLKKRRELPFHTATVLKDSHGKRRTGGAAVLSYLFEFLDAYDFAAEGNADIQEENKSIISAAVLGLIFEKINGYKDGSFFTPGFITMYMCRETIRRAVVDKLRGADIPGLAKVTDFADLKDQIDRTDRDVRKKANDSINSLKLCDPAVGSGHFLVSALNEIIAIKSELGVLCYRDNGDRVKEYRVTVEQDELLVIDKDTDHLFEYVLNRNSRPDDDQQRLQETLFHEKQTIIENCLFGVDINPKSVSICRLRLWIELLKNAYYTNESGYTELETLPNIDINIKCGNSLVSRFAIKGDANVYATERYKLKAITDRYREKVRFYKQGPANKTILRKEIARIKEELQNFAVPTDPDLIALRKMKNELDQLGLGMVSDELERYRALVAREEELKRKVEEKQATVYGNAFEWRFEFPEVLDENGEFTGFDVVMGNPPYGVDVPKDLKPFYQTFALRGESYVLFVERAFELLGEGGQFCYITPDTCLNLGFTAPLRTFLLKNSKIREIVALPAKVFDEAVVDTTLLFATKAPSCRSFHDGQVRVKTFSKQARNIDLSAPSRQDLIEISQWHQLGAFNVHGDTDTAALLNRLDLAFPKIDTIAELFYGIKAYQRGKGKPPQTEEIRVAKPFTAITRLHDGFLPFYDGKHVGRYRLFWQENNWLHYGPWLAEPRSPEKFIGEKILIRKIVGETLIATHVPDTSYCNTLLYVLKLKPGISLSYLYLLGVLNSRFIGWYFRAKFQISAEDTFPQIMISDIQQFPIPSVSESEQAPLIELVQKILALKENANTGFDSAQPTNKPINRPLSGVEGNIPALEAEIDRLVYALYGLSEEEITVVEGRK